MAEPKPRQRSVRIPQLATMNDLKDECIRLYRRAAKGTIDSADASRQASILRVAKECVAEAKLEAEVAELRAVILTLKAPTLLNHVPIKSITEE